MFGPNKNKEGKYYLLASEWKNNTGKVTMKVKYISVPHKSGKAFITLNIKKLFQLEKEKRKAKGRKL